MRLAANVGCRLHLIEPLGFAVDDSRLRRAGMDYRDRATVVIHQDLAAWIKDAHTRRVFAFSNQGETRYSDVDFEIGDSLLFGPESVGLPEEVMHAPFVTDVVQIPMQPGVRSLNLANAAAIAVYEAWRQHSFVITDPPPT